jgi:CelD/BcsL family acetyltransferase involved in cellulose biosynthesis
MLTLVRVDPERVDWDALDSFPDRNVYQTREWLSFTAKTQQADPVLATVEEEGEVVGFFTGLIVRRYGIRILGSPFRGWTTAYLGFNLRAGVSRPAAVEAMLPFAFGRLGCMHVELRDRHLDLEDVEGMGFASSPKTIFEVDLRASEDEFATDYYRQLQDVFAKQSLVPTYDRARVEELTRHLQPTGRLLLLRARSSTGQCIATGIFPAMNKTMYFWGGASFREHQILRPNELLMWHAMKYWKSRGIEWCDLGGGADYKRKYGPIEVSVPFFRMSRFAALSGARDLAKKAMKLRQAARGRLNTVRKS